ncbi:MAG: DUF177 domain-containing protein [Desulfuromonadales bacterium]|nr:DUF177 domain-containing protein [Desulfuromonadales bacterium]
MKIKVSDITDKEKKFDFDGNFTDYPALSDVVKAGECSFLAPISVSISVFKEFDHIRLYGKIGTKIELLCSRCLSNFNRDISSTFTVFYSEADRDIIEDEVELAEEDLLSSTYIGDEIDLTDLISGQVIMELPYKSLCSEECLGLCPICGTDLNKSSCDCSSQKGSFAFEALKGLKLKQ